MQRAFGQEVIAGQLGGRKQRLCTCRLCENVEGLMLTCKLQSSLSPIALALLCCTAFCGIIHMFLFVDKTSLSTFNPADLSVSQKRQNAKSQTTVIFFEVRAAPLKPHRRQFPANPCFCRSRPVQDQHHRSDRLDISI
jgi:hypothetical protein